MIIREYGGGGARGARNGYDGERGLPGWGEAPALAPRTWAQPKGACRQSGDEPEHHRPARAARSERKVPSLNRPQTLRRIGRRRRRASRGLDVDSLACDSQRSLRYSHQIFPSTVQLRLYFCQYTFAMVV